MLVLSGCSTIWSKPVIIEARQPIQVVCGESPSVDQLRLREVKPRAVKDTDERYWVGLTPRHYENLAKNLQDILAVIKQHRALQEYYGNCIVRHNTDLKDDADTVEPQED